MERSGDPKEMGSQSQSPASVPSPTRVSSLQAQQSGIVELAL